jgi:hypothetical protein
VFTASGIDPALLKAIPWMARHAVASEPDRSKALQMFEDLSGPGGDGLAASSEFASHPNNKAYEQRVMEWASNGWAAQDTARDEPRRVAASAQAEAVAEAVGPVEEWTEEQCYEHVFGEVDPREAAEKARIERSIAEGHAIIPWTRVTSREAPQ